MVIAMNFSRERVAFQHRRLIVEGAGEAVWPDGGTLTVHAEMPKKRTRRIVTPRAHVESGLGPFTTRPVEINAAVIPR
jgi:hypothetical protein